MDDAVRQKAFEMFAEGASVNAVGVLCSRTIGQPRRSSEPSGSNRGGASTVATAPKKAAKKKPKKQRPVAEYPELAEESPAEWQLQIDVPTEGLDPLFQSFTPQEKANAVQHVIQQRMCALLA